MIPDRIKLVENEFNDRFRVAALWISVRLLSDFLALWEELPSAMEIYSPVLNTLRKLPINRYNSQVQQSVSLLIANLEKQAGKTKKRLVHEAKKPKPLRLYEPVIEDQ